MTSLSQYMAAESFDITEEVTFYIPGARGWSDPLLSLLRAMRSRVSVEILYPAKPDEEQDESS